MCAMGDGEREDRCVEDVQSYNRVRGPTLCLLSPAELLCILKTVSFIQCKCGASWRDWCIVSEMDGSR